MGATLKLVWACLAMDRSGIRTLKPKLERGTQQMAILQPMDEIASSSHPWCDFSQ